MSNSPTYTDGYMLLSQSLAENRQEREAIEIYDRALDLLKKGGPQADDRREFEARFLKASSLLRCYRWADVNNARKEFTNLASELEQLTKTKPTAAAGGESKKSLVDRWHDDLYMLARCHAEAAHCFGHMIVLLPKDRPVPADFLPDLAELKLLKEGRRNQIGDESPNGKKLSAGSIDSPAKSRKKPETSLQFTRNKEATWRCA